MLKSKEEKSKDEGGRMKDERKRGKGKGEG